MSDGILGPDRVKKGDELVAAVDEVVRQGTPEQWFIDIESSNFLSLHRTHRLIEERRSRHQLIQIIDVEEYGKTLLLDGRIQMADSDEHIYHEMFVHPAMVWGKYETVLVLGGGDGCIVRELIKWSSIRRILVVELDEEVVAACRKAAPEWTAAFADERVEVAIDDAMNVLKSEEQFDLILADLTEPYDDSGVGGDLSSSLFDEDFYESVKEKLTPHGLFAAQTGGMRLGRSSLDTHHVRFVNDLKGVFGHVKVAYEFIPSFQAFWTITFASPEGFEGDVALREMWRNFEDNVWDELNQDLDREGIETAYYDGTTHVRLFTPPIDQSLLYGWDDGCCW